MAVVLDPDIFRGAAYRNMVEHLSGPLTAGAEDNEVPIDATGKAAVWEARHPLLVASLREPLDTVGSELTAALPGPADQKLEFAPYTEAGAFLPVYVPPVDPDTHVAQAFTVSVALTQGGVAVKAADVAGLVELRLIEGLFGRMLFLLSSEKARLRREGRTIGAMRYVARARDDALDRTGAELGIPRFIGSHQSGGLTVLDREDDAGYRTRLGPYKPWFRSTRQRVLDTLNGPGKDTDPNAGALHDLGFAQRFTVEERDNPFAVAVMLVASGTDADRRTNFLAFVRTAHLIWPLTDSASNKAHSSRFLPDGRAANEADLRKGLRTLFTFTGDAAATPAVAPMLAGALIRAARCRAALGIATPWNLTRAQKNDGGSRYELGLGVNVVPFAAADLKAMAAALPNAQADPETRALLDTMTPQPAAQDPNGAWLLGPCGLRTSFLIDPGTLYLSHLPIFGLTIDGASPIPAAGWAIVVPGYFGSSRTSGDLLLYDRSTGDGEFLGLGDGVAPITTAHGWRTSWTHIVGGRFGGSTPLTDLLFYERSSGTVEFYSTTAQGAINFLGTDKTGTSWSAIAPCELGRPRSGLFCYDRTQGTAQFFTTDGQGHLTPIGGPLTGLRRGWTDVVAGNFGGREIVDLFFYDSESGDGQLCSTDGFGGLHPYTDVEWDDGWTHVVAGTFTGSDTDGLVFYDTEHGVLALYSLGAGGTLTRVARHTNVRPGWTHLAAGNHGEEYSELFAYDRKTGQAAWYLTDGAGTFVARRLQHGWRQTAPQTFGAHYASQSDPASNVVLAQGVTATATAWTGAGNAAFTVRTSATAPAQKDRWAQAIAPGAAGTVFAAAELPNVADPTIAVAQLNALPGELINTLELPAALAAQIVGGAAAATAPLKTLTSMLRANGISSALPLVLNGGAVVLVVGVIGLPASGINLSDQPSSGFRWYEVPIDGYGGVIQPVGAQTTLLPKGEGLSALVAVGYARVGLTDPYEYRPELADGVVLSPPQYELLMNLLELATPVGVRVNTYSIREQHVDLDGDGQPDALDPAVSRTYRKFRRRRHLGEFGVTDKS